MSGDRLKLATLLSAALAGGLLAAGCGGGEEQSQPASERRPAEGGGEGARGSSQSGSISQSTRSGSGANQSTSINQRSSGGSSSSSSQSSSGGGGVSTFSGTGATTLSFNVERPSRLAWTNSEGKPFSATGAGISIDSRRGRGEVELHPGDYDDVKVEGASWTIVVRPR